MSVGPGGPEGTARAAGGSICRVMSMRASKRYCTCVIARGGGGSIRGRQTVGVSSTPVRLVQSKVYWHFCLEKGEGPEHSVGAEQAKHAARGAVRRSKGSPTTAATPRGPCRPLQCPKSGGGMPLKSAQAQVARPERKLCHQTGQYSTVPKFVLAGDSLEETRSGLQVLGY